MWAAHPSRWEHSSKRGTRPRLPHPLAMVPVLEGSQSWALGTICSTLRALSRPSLTMSTIPSVLAQPTVQCVT